MIEMIVIQGATFLVLILFLKKVLYNHFAKAMRRLEALNQEAERKKVLLQAKLEEAQRDLKAKEKEIEEQQAKAREELELEAEQMKTHALETARAEADRILESARAKEEQMRRALEAESAEKAARFAADALRYVFSTQLDEGIHRQLIADLMRDLEKIEPKRLSGSSQEAHVAVPFELEEKEKSRLAEILGERARRKIQVICELDRSLLAGMVLKFENVILDGSLKAKLKEAVGYVRKGEKREG